MSNFIKEDMLPLIDTLNKATEAYDKSMPIMTDAEWDKLYFSLVALERRFNYAYPHSPTQTIHYTVANKLEKVTHNHPMLSLEKTKNPEEIREFIGNKDIITMLKMDGLTCSLIYKNGKLVSAETRGDGEVGEQILHNAMMLPSIPKTIDIIDEVTFDGEIICNTEDFKEWEDKYANCRNFAAGSIRLLNSKECAERHLTFVAWDWIKSSGNNLPNTLEEKLIAMNNMNFTVVPYIKNFDIDYLTEIATEKNYPIDGLVVKYNDCDYYESLGKTSHHFKGGLAFKFFDDSVTSHLLDIDYEVSRNGILTPVAIYEDVELEGSVNSRASLHNLTMMYKILGFPYVGQEVEIVKQNMIIPQIINSIKKDKNENSILIPTYCPNCHEPLEVVCENESEILLCTNMNCSCRIINQLEYFCSKKGLDIKGLSKATLQKLLDWGWLENKKDIFNLYTHRAEWIKKPGFGPKSVDNILTAIESSRKCKLESFIAALGIPLIGPNVSKEIVKYFPTWQEFIDAIDNHFKFYTLSGFGEEKSNSLLNFDYTEARYIIDNFIDFSIDIAQNNYVNEEQKMNGDLKGKSFVVTGKLTMFKNRDELKSVIEAKGGKVVSAISKNTYCLINNDIESNSSKNREAKALGITILSEKDFIETYKIFS